MNKKKVYAFIPAKNNSVRLKRKNFLRFKGKKNYKIVLDTCLNSKIFHHIFLSTNEKKCINEVKNKQITVNLRPKKLTKKSSSVVDVCIYLIKKYDLKRQDIFCVIYPTAILLKKKTLKLSLRNFFKNNCNVLMGASTFNYNPLMAIRYDKKKSFFFPLNKQVRKYNTSEKFYFSNGTFYWARVSSFLKEKTFYSKKLDIYKLPNSEAHDIDTRNDWKELKKRNL